VIGGCGRSSTIEIVAPAASWSVVFSRGGRIDAPRAKEGVEPVSVSGILAGRSNTCSPGDEVDVEKKKRVHS
jgi:hypothetical protein